MGAIRFGPARVPSQESSEAAVEALKTREYTACEIDFEGRFWMDYDFATRLGELCREADIAFANRNETKHLSYGDGTLRAAPLGEALTQFDRPATVITESPDLESHEAIREELYAAVGTRSASRASTSAASASRSSERKNSA